MYKNKIAILTYNAIPYSNSWGGCQRVHYMANALAHKHDVTVIASKNRFVAINTSHQQLYKTKFYDNKLHNKILGQKENGDINVKNQKHIIKNFFFKLCYSKTFRIFYLFIKSY